MITEGVLPQDEVATVISIVLKFGVRIVINCCPMCLHDTILDLLTPNDDYSGRTAPLSSKCCILYIYSTNIGTKNF